MIALLLRMQSQSTTLCPLILFIVSNYDFRLLECVPADHGLDSTTLEKLRNGRGRFQKESSYRYKSIIVTSNLCHSFHRSLNRQAMSSRMCIAECSATHTHTHTRLLPQTAHSFFSPATGESRCQFIKIHNTTS